MYDEEYDNDFGMSNEELFHYNDTLILALERKRDENDTICATIEQEATLTPFNLQ